MKLFGRKDETPRRPSGLAADARAMRETLAAMQAEHQLVHGPRAGVDVRSIVRELLEGEVAAPTADVSELIRNGTEPAAFYDRELAPAWDELGESQRAARVEGFIELARMLEQAGEVPGLAPESVRTKTLILAWAFDETYGYLTQLGRGESSGGGSAGGD